MSLVELGVVVGLVVALASVLISNAIEGGTVGSLINPSAMLLILGGTVGATMVSVGLKNFLSLPGLLARVIKQPQGDPRQMMETLISFAQKARREGLLALEEDVQQLPDRFMAKGLQMVVDGADTEMVETILMTEVELTEKHLMAGAGILETAGGYAPTMGIIGTVMGLIHVLSNLENPNELGPAIAVAFLATFWGIATANLFWLPVAGKLKVLAREEAELRTLVVEGILSIQKGDSPAILREKLEAFVAHRPQPKKAEEAAAAPQLNAGEERA